MSGAGKNPLVGVRASIYERRGKDETFLMTVSIQDVNPGRLWAQVVVVPKPPSSLIVATNEQPRHRIGDLVEVQTGAAWRISLTEHPEAPRGDTRGMLQAVALLLAAKDGKRAVYVADSVLAAWPRLKFAAGALGIDARFHETSRTVHIGETGSVRVVLADDPDRVRGLVIDAAVVDRRTDAIDRAIAPRLGCNGWVVYTDEAML